MAEDLAAVAVTHSKLTDTVPAGRAIATTVRSQSIAERLERPIELLSRWAGILAFVGTLAVITYLLL